MLHVEEATYSKIGSEGDKDEFERIPWDVLVSLNDRLPGDVEETVGNFALVSLRVRELFEEGRKWQEEITQNTMLSIRGGKRRAPTASSVGSPSKEQDPENSNRIQMQKMEQLAEHPVLLKVRSNYF